METNQPTPATPSIAQQIGLNNLQIITTDDSLIRYFHDLIADYIKTPRSDEQLSKLKSLIVICYDLKAVDKEGRSYDDPYKKNKYDDFVRYLGLPELSTADLFWTGKSMVKRSCIIGWNWKGIYTKDTSDKVEFHEFNASMVGYFLDSNKPERRQLVRFLESTDKEIEIPCITPTYIHLNNCSFPLKYLKGINNLGWLNFVEGFPICSYYVQQSITPLIERKLCFALGFHSIPYPIPEENQKESLAQGFAKIDIESDLEQLKEQTNDGSLVRYFHDKILNYVSTPPTTHSEEELKKVKQLVKLIAGFVNMVTIDDLSKKRIYDDNVQILKIPQLSTADLFWTGRQMIQRQKIIGFYRCTIITDESNKIVHHTMIPSVHFPDETELDLRKLIDQRFNESMIIPCITPSHIHLENSLFPINWISNIEREPGNFLNFVKGFGIIAYRVDRSSLTPLIEEKLNCAIKLYSELRDQGRTIDDKLLNDIAEEFRRLESPQSPQSPQTPATPATQPIWNQSFTCQVFLQRDEKNTIFTFEKFYQALITKIESYGFDKTKCHCLLFESTDGKPILWITVEGMTQEQLEAFWPKQKQINVFSEYKFNYEPHISPLMLKNAKPFRHSCVTIKNPASFFIHGDSSANWNSLYDSLGKGARTLMFVSRKNGYLPGRTLYVVTDDIGAPTTEEFLETVNPLKEFIIPPNYSTQMIDIIIPTDRNDPELLKQYQKVN